MSGDMRQLHQPAKETSRSAIPDRSRTTSGVLRAGGCICCAMVVLCCLSCSRDASELPGDQSQPVAVDGVAVTGTKGNVTLQPSSSQSSDKHVRRGGKSKEGSSTREESHTSKPTSAVHENGSRDAGVHRASQITTSIDRKRLEEIRQDLDPSNDGWDTEVFSEAANKQLKRLGKLMVSGHLPTTGDLSTLLSEDFSCSALRPADLQQVFADGSLTVLRPEKIEPEVVHHGASGLTSALMELTAGLEGASHKYFKFKLFRVNPSGQQTETTSYLEISGRRGSGAIQRSSTWKCRWEPEAGKHGPLLSSITLEDYEEAEVHHTEQTLFSDCTESIFRDSQAYDEQFRRGIDYWRARLERYLKIFYDGLRGLALGDVNGDGLEDVYLCEPGGLPNRLFVQTPEGLLKDISAESGVDLLDSTRLALFVDLDNDGDQDLVFPAARQIHFFAGDGKGHFVRKVNMPFVGETAFTLSAADYDEDGKIDVYVCFYHGLDDEESNRSLAPLPYHDARTGGFNRLLRNEGNWQFRDVTVEVGLDHNNDRFSFAAVWEDYDNDDDLDFYVANDYGRNNLYRQENGRFKDVAGPAGAEDMNFGMGATFGDYNRDGLMDIYVSNMFSGAGGRIAFQPGFQREGTREVKAVYQRMAAGNTLLQNVGDGTFRDVSAQARVGVGRWAWGSLFADINNDGWEDLLVANGFVTGNLPGDL